MVNVSDRLATHDAARVFRHHFVSVNLVIAISNPNKVVVLII